MPSRPGRALLSCLLGVLLLTFLAAPLSSTHAQTNKEAQDFLKVINERRTAANLPPLTVDSALQVAAQSEADKLAASGSGSAPNAALQSQFKNLKNVSAITRSMPSWNPTWVVDSSNGFKSVPFKESAYTVIGVGVTKNAREANSYVWHVYIAESKLGTAPAPQATTAPQAPTAQPTQAPATQSTQAPTAQPTQAPATQPGGSQPAATVNSDIDAFLKAINSQRAAKNAPPLTIDPNLQLLAQPVADQLAAGGSATAPNMAELAKEYKDPKSVNGGVRGMATWEPASVIRWNQVKPEAFDAGYTIAGIGLAKYTKEAGFTWYILLSKGIVTGPAQAPAPGSTGKGDMQLDALEVTQGVQNSLNEMPLLKGRPTFVVTHLRSLIGKNIRAPKLQLVVINAQGKELGRLDPINPTISVVPPENPDFAQRKNANAYSYFYQLKSEWLTGDLTLKLEGTPLVCNEASDSTKDCAVKASFARDLPVLNVLFLLGKQAEGAATEADAAKMAQMLEAFYPVKIAYSTEVWEYKNGRIADSTEMRTLLGQLQTRYEKDGKPAKHYIALFPHPKGTGGVAYQTSPLFVVTSLDAQTLIAHEFGHTFGLGHGYDEPNNPRDTRFPPYLNSTVSPKMNQLSAETSGPKAYYGFLISEGWYPANSMPYGWRVMPNKGEHMGGDVMNGGYWVSEFTYRWVMDKLPTVYTKK